jgi:hypothetical protein
MKVSPRFTRPTFSNKRVGNRLRGVREQPVQNIGTVTILAGIAIATLAQIVGAVVVFRSSLLKGVLSLLIPGYFLFALRSRGWYGRIVGTWGVGIAAVALGTVLSS